MKTIKQRYFNDNGWTTERSKALLYRVKPGIIAGFFVLVSVFVHYAMSI